MTKDQEKELSAIVNFARKNHLTKFKSEALGVEFELAPKPVKHRNRKAETQTEEPTLSEDDVLEWSSRAVE